MDGLILLLILIPIVYLILLLIIIGKSSSQQESLNSLKQLLNQVRDQVNHLDLTIKNLQKEELTKKPGPQKEMIREVVNPAVEIPPLVVQEEKPAVKIETPVAPVVPTEKVIAEKTPGPVEVLPGSPFTGRRAEVKKTDWEKFIGENLANKIGIAVLVLGISFFVKFAIDKDWINELGRVVIGLVSGGILIVLAHRIKNSYRSFSSVLVGGGLTVFYFTIAFAFHQYGLIGQGAAFSLMLVITAFAIVLSLLYNRLELAILATIGGFITPFLVSTGQNNYVSLFTYLGILNSGLLVLSWFRKWKAVNIIALFFTIIIYGGWLVRQLFDESQPFPYGWALLFATVFYAFSITMNIINNLKLNIKFGAFDFILLLSINFLYYVAGILILDHWNEGVYQGLFTAALGVVNLILAWIFFSQRRADKNFVYLLIGITVTFISLTAPVQLEGNNITLFWAAESVVLFWLYQRSRIDLLKIASLIIILPLLVSLFMDWGEVYVKNIVIPVIANKGFITTLATGIAFFLYHLMMRQEADSFYLPGIHNKRIRSLLLTGGVLLAYAAGALEVYYQFMTRLPGTSINIVYLGLFSFAFITLLLVIFRRSPSFIVLKFLLTITAVLIYIFSLRINNEVSLQMLSTGRNSVHFTAHWISVALLGWLLYDLVAYFRKQKQTMSDYEIPFAWLVSASFVLLLSVEMFHVIMWSMYSNADNREYWENLYYKAGLSIVWGLCSFLMIWLGMRYKFKTLRVISLSLFTVTLVKLFLYDISNIPPGGKIAAFILLGVLLLIVSFMYQRLKSIIIDDQQKS